MTSPVAVRHAVEADVDRLVELYAAVAAESIWIGAEPPVDVDDATARWLRMLADDRHVLLVAEAGSEVVGQLSIEVTPYGVGFLGMHVDRGWRGRGVGTALIEHALDAAPAQGLHKLALQVWPHNEAARGLYRKMGFVEEGTLRRQYPRRNGELWDAVIMGLVLDEERPGFSGGAAG